MNEVIEYPEFIKQAAKVLGDKARHSFIDYIAKTPKAGDIIKGSGGFRKVRYSASGRGKSGGVRVIYFFSDNIIRLITVYAKANTENLTKEQTNQLYKLAQIIKKKGE